MATQRINQTQWANGKGFVDMEYDDVLLRAVDFPYANNASGLAVIDVYRISQQGVATLAQSISLQPGDSGTYTPTGGNLNLSQDADGFVSLDHWRINSRGPAT